MRGTLRGLPVRQARLARASPEASIAGSFLLQLMRILTEEKGSAEAGDLTAAFLPAVRDRSPSLHQVPRNRDQAISTLRIGIHENPFLAIAITASCLLFSWWLVSTPTPTATAVDVDASQGCISRITQEFEAQDQNRMHAKALDSGFSFEHFRRMWITFRAMQECPLLGEFDE